MEVIESRDLGRATMPRPAESPGGFLHEAYQAHCQRFAAQPQDIRQAIEKEAGHLGGLLSQTEPAWHAGFALPETVVVGPQKERRLIPADRRVLRVGTWMDRLRGRGLRSTLRLHLLRLEQSTDRSVATAAKLIRHATAVWIIQHAGEPRLAVPPSPTAMPEEEMGRVGPEAAGGNGADGAANSGEPPSNPEWPGSEVAPVSYSVPAWVAFDERDRLLVGSVSQAESYLGLLQDALAALRAAISLAPYMIADPAYQAKRAGLLVQLADQGRALARFQTREIVSVLQRRTAEGQLNRGLKVSLPYYDDQALVLTLRTFDIIPAGRIMYVAALAVRAVQDEQAKVAQDTRLSSSTRDHVLEELEMLRRAFRGDGGNGNHA